MPPARIGLIVPSSNVTVETEIPRILARASSIQFSFHSSRMRMHAVTRDQLLAMNAQRERCVLEIGDARVDALLYACLVAIMATGPGASRAPSMDKLLTRKAELIVERAAGWERSNPGWREAEKEMV